MDEATSHLDTTLEAYINEEIKHLDMIVAHRKENITSATSRRFILKQ